MYTENDFMTPRERVNDALLRRALEESSDSRALNRGVSCKNTPIGSSDHASPRSTRGLEEYPLASMFAPLQVWRNLYDTETGFSRGTIFKELDLPFLGGEKGGNCRGR